MLKQSVIAICGPRGSTDPLIHFFDHTPLNNASYVILRHLPSNYQAVLDSILERHSKLRVIEAENGASIENDFVYYAPPYFQLEIQDGTIHCIERDGGLNWAFDIFLNSLALNENRRKAVAVVLSGSGSDGIEGIKAIKKAGGLVIVQLPESCEYPELPLQIIAEDIADFILLPEDMPIVIQGYVNSLSYKNANQNITPKE